MTALAPQPTGPAPALAADPPVTLGQEIRRQLQAAPWYLTSTAVHMVALLLLMLIPTMPPDRPRDVLILHGDIPDPPPVQDQPDPDPEPEDPDDVLSQIMRDTANPAPELTEQAVETPVNPTDIVVDTEPVTIEVSEVAADSPSDDAAEDVSEPAPVPMGVGAALAAKRGSGVSGRRGSIGRIGREIATVAKIGTPGGGGRGLLLVWLLDQSASMKDDQEAVAAHARDIQELLTRGGKRNLLTAVACYGAGWQVLQKPTRDTAAIGDAIRNSPVDRTGQENACSALVGLSESLLAGRTGWTKVVVVLSDENTSDGDAIGAVAGSGRLDGRERRLPLLEVALKRLVETKTRLLVVGKESPFQFARVYEPYVDPTGKTWPMWASRGPESARIEVPLRISQNFERRGLGQFRGDEVKSGFGVYDLAYLAARSGGAYFILDPTAGDERPMSVSEGIRNPFRIDWNRMDLYRPELVSRLVYEERLSQHRYGQALVRLHALLDERKPAIDRKSFCRPPSRQPAQLAQLRARRALLDRLIEVIGPARADEETLERSETRRHIANIDLFYCVLLADRIITESWLAAYEAYNGPLDDATEPGYWSELVLRPIPGAALEEEARILFAHRMDELVVACNDVIRRHRNTPWAVAARWLQSGPRRWGRPHELIWRKHKHGTHHERPDIDGI
ncbi:MAG: vWA domain-containing protein [Planctomycetota bacterium]